jgi:hypothetical protein
MKHLFEAQREWERIIHEFAFAASVTRDESHRRLSDVVKIAEEYPEQVLFVVQCYTLFAKGNEFDHPESLEETKRYLNTRVKARAAGLL